MICGLISFVIINPSVVLSCSCLDALSGVEVTIFILLPISLKENKIALFYHQPVQFFMVFLETYIYVFGD